MTTPHRPSLGSPSNSRPPSFLKQLLNEIGGTSTPIGTRNGKTLQSSPRSGTSRDAEKRAPAVWVGGASAAQDAREKLRAADEARLRRVNTPETEGILRSSSLHQRRGFPPSRSVVTSSGNHCSGSRYRNETSGGAAVEQNPTLCDDYVLSGDALPSSQPRLNLEKLKIPQPVISDSETAESSSPLTSCESDLASTASSSEIPTSALTASSTNAASTFSRHGWRSNVSRKRERSLDDTEDELMLKKMRSATSPQTRDLAITSNSEPNFSKALRNISDRDRCILHDTTFARKTVAGTSISKPTEHQLLELSNFEPSAITQSLELIEEPRQTTPVQLSTWRRNSITPEPPETPSFARSLHLFDTSVSMYKDDHGNEWVHDISIYKSTHGDESAKNSLCKHCFCRKGKFSRITMYGYETCGREEYLDDYYWEPTVTPNC